MYIHSARVGMIIGKKGQEVDKLTKELEDLTHRHIEVKTMEVNRPEVDPQLVAEDIAEQLQKRAELPPDDEAGDRQTMEGGRQGHPHADVGPAGRRGNGPHGKRHGGQHSAVDAAGQGGIRLHRGQDGAGEHRYQGVDQQRGLSGPPRRTQQCRRCPSG